LQEGIHQGVAPGDEREVAIATAVTAERNVNIGRTRRSAGWNGASRHFFVGNGGECSGRSECSSQDAT